nr:4-amino-4-deoxy-L-arabinose transferase [Nocardioides perillae]
MVCVDGPAGSGKTTLAAALDTAARAVGLTTGVVHGDDLLAGWSGLPGLAGSLATALAPLAEGRPGAYRRRDWVADRWAEEVAVPVVDLLVVEGVGSGTPLLDGWRSVLVWVEAPRDLRLARGLARDGEAFAPHWEAWARDEEAVQSADRTRERADVLVDGTGATSARARRRGPTR